MFLSKLFSIFKSKKDQNAPNDSASGGPVVTPSSVVGAAAGLGQPSQPMQPDLSSEPTQAEAPSPPPEIAQADTPAPSAPSFDAASDDNNSAEADDIPPPAEQQTSSADQEQPAGDTQDTTIGGNDDAGVGTENPLGQDPVIPPAPSDNQDTDVATPPPSDDDQLPTV
ncbi:MAG TPA: hypothetical protein VFW77_02140 [Candidatus Saccharimonadales bacterium]|nr:hypothetical protein [Candidatus Saccharimonadales bacterium]